MGVVFRLMHGAVASIRQFPLPALSGKLHKGSKSEGIRVA
jgi:hypothetical protein